MSFRVGDEVVFQVEKHSVSPGPRAKNVYAAPKGEFYNYSVDKFWRVEDVLGDGQLTLVTRRGKRHIVSANDARLRKATLWERIAHRRRFPALQKPKSQDLKNQGPNRIP